MASMQSFAAFGRIPVETWEQIAHALPKNSLSSFVLSCRKFYECANPFLYRSVYLHVPDYTHKISEAAKARADEESCFGAHRAQSWLSRSTCSSAIKRPEAFLRTITTNPELRSQIVGASFEWDDRANTPIILVVKQCLENLKMSLSLLRLALPGFDPKFAITTNVTFLEMSYPDELLLTTGTSECRYDADLHKGLREYLHSIFCIPTLRHLSLQNARTWHAFSPVLPPDESKAGTSNVISLSLPNTVPLSRDLAEILLWPKALRYFYHENVLGRRYHFQHYGTEQNASPELFIQGVYPHRHAIEELFYDNEEADYGNDETTFGTSLGEFDHLKRLAVSRNCLLRDGPNHKPLYLNEMLPPNLEELCLLLDCDDHWDEKAVLFLKQWLREIALNKEKCCPYLKYVVLWSSNIRPNAVPDEYQSEANKILSQFDLVSTFDESEIELEFTFGTYNEFGKLKEMGWKTLQA